MKNFENTTLKDIQLNIQDLEFFIKNGVVKHFNGYHGSSKDKCSCGELNANESEICWPQTKTYRAHRLKYKRKLEKLHSTLKKNKNRKLILPFIKIEQWWR